jgi:hypothetical protein
MYYKIKILVVCFLQINNLYNSIKLKKVTDQMKTHMNNTQSLSLKNDIVAHAVFKNHQQSLHSKIKPEVVTKRK